MLRPIDVQNVILKSFEVSKVQNQKVHNPEIEQHSKAQIEKDKAIINQSKIQEIKHIDSQIVHSKEENEKRNQQHKNFKNDKKNDKGEKKMKTNKPQNEENITSPSPHKIDIKV